MSRTFCMSDISKSKLDTCHPDLQMIFERVSYVFPILVLKGHRSKKQQEALYGIGLSKLIFPESKHNSTPSLAVDVAPFPLNWQNELMFYFLAGVVKCVCSELHINVIWGGDLRISTFGEDKKYNLINHYELGNSYKKEEIKK